MRRNLRRTHEGKPVCASSEKQKSNDDFGTQPSGPGCRLFRFRALAGFFWRRAATKTTGRWRERRRAIGKRARSDSIEWIRRKTRTGNGRATAGRGTTRLPLGTGGTANARARGLGTTRTITVPSADRSRETVPRRSVRDVSFGERVSAVARGRRPVGATLKGTAWRPQEMPPPALG